MKGPLAFPLHLKMKHGMNTRAYYDLFLRKDKEGSCFTCSALTKFHDLRNGYREFCSHACADSSDEVKKRRQKTTFERLGVDNAFQSEEKKCQSKQTMMINHGVNHPMQSDIIKKKIKQTNLKRYGNEWQIASGKTKKKIQISNVEKYGTENPLTVDGPVREKSRQTMRDRYGTDWALQSEINKSKARKTMIERYGAEYSAQVPELRRKQRNSAKDHFLVKVLGREFDCQGSFEKLFIENAEIFCGISALSLSSETPSIPYIDSLGKHRKYIPDFITDDMATIIEIKSTWTFNGNGKQKDWLDLIIRKLEGAVSAGYKFVVITIDKHRTVLRRDTELCTLRECFDSM